MSDSSYVERYETVYEEQCSGGSSQQQCTTVNEQVASSGPGDEAGWTWPKQPWLGRVEGPEVTLPVLGVLHGGGGGVQDGELPAVLHHLHHPAR